MLESKIQSLESIVENRIDKLTSHPKFLQAVSLMINANSYRKIFLRKVLETVWHDLELPNRLNQEKMQSQVEEILLRLQKMELELETNGSGNQKIKTTRSEGKGNVKVDGKIKFKDFEIQ